MSKESKFLARLLRHDRKIYDLYMDRHGWVGVDKILREIKIAGFSVNKDQLHDLVYSAENKRFSIDADGRKIRALYGHSVKIDYTASSALPPKILLHGTATKNLTSIFAKGLEPGLRLHVHLSVDHKMAQRIGQRHGKPVVLRVSAELMRQDGHEFFDTGKGIWLTKFVPSKFLEFSRGNQEDGYFS